MANYVYADTNTDLTLTFETESFGGNLIVILVQILGKTIVSMEHQQIL